jgi:hypothetical protein
VSSIIFIFVNLFYKCLNLLQDLPRSRAQHAR